MPQKSTGRSQRHRRMQRIIPFAVTPNRRHASLLPFQRCGQRGAPRRLRREARLLRESLRGPREPRERRRFGHRAARCAQPQQLADLRRERIADQQLASAVHIGAKLLRRRCWHARIIGQHDQLDSREQLWREIGVGHLHRFDAQPIKRC